MCVIAICQDKRIPLEDVEACYKRNDDGAGIAWLGQLEEANSTPKHSNGRHGDSSAKTHSKVIWKKGLSLKEVSELTESLPLPYVVHFRIASAGGKSVRLTHPF